MHVGREQGETPKHMIGERRHVDNPRGCKSHNANVIRPLLSLHKHERRVSVPYMSIDPGPSLVPSLEFLLNLLASMFPSSLNPEAITR
jgi:hypothetical protein